MSIPAFIEKSFQLATDLIFSIWPQPVPGGKQLMNCKIISHRGEHDNRTIFENTIPAFENSLQNNIWGIELDLRWTKDLHPVIFHDSNLERLFHSNIEISQLRLAELQKNFPLIPTLDEVVEKFGKKLHLMLEIKKEFYPEPDYQNQVLQKIFAPLSPLKDFHILSLSPEMFPIITFVDQSSFLPIAELNFTALSNMALKNNFCGITGHYLFLSNSILQKHWSVGQKVGTGFISSRNALFRELNRGVDWIFSNHAEKLQHIRDHYLTIAYE
ncbi:MAG: glycerophosphodiester phosphodiesterase [Desulfobacterales bacterium]